MTCCNIQDVDAYINGLHRNMFETCNIHTQTVSVCPHIHVTTLFNDSEARLDHLYKAGILHVNKPLPTSRLESLILEPEDTDEDSPNYPAVSKAQLDVQLDAYTYVRDNGHDSDTSDEDGNFHNENSRETHSEDHIPVYTRNCSDDLHHLSEDQVLSIDAELPTSRSESLVSDLKDSDNDTNEYPHVTKEALDLELDEYFKRKQSTPTCPML
jgi:hypothetical protein